MRRLPLLIAVAAGAVLASPPTSQADIFKSCVKSSLGECAYVNVPIDHSGVVPGSIPLYVERAKGDAQAKGALFALAGGPGQAGGSVSRDLSRALGAGFKTHDLIVFDQRGTGRSGDLDCISLEQARTYHADNAVKKCAARLGARRALYTSRDSADDLEAIRQQIGVDKIAIYGVSYGTKVALTYAQRYPEHVERLILDSVVEQGGPDPLYRPNFQTLPRILERLCAGRCQGITPDPTADLAALVRKMAGGPVRGTVITDSGRRTTETMARTELYQLILAGDFDATVRAELPAAVRSVLDGDPGPLLRLKRRVATHPSFARPPQAFSNAVFTATICEESALPWDRSSPPDQHLAQARERVAAMPESSFFPFDHTTSTNTDIVALCKDWPQGIPAPDVTGPLPDVPVLILSGLDDFRTPLEGAERTAALFPRAKLLKVPNSGHSVLGSDFTGCADRALRRFFKDDPAITTCPNRPLVRPAGIAPTSLSKVAPLGSAGGLRGRTLGGIEETLDDIRSQLAEIAGGQIFFDQDVTDGGLRGGSFAFNGSRLRLRRLSFVPGLELNGKLHEFDLSGERGRIKVSGPKAAHGVLELHSGRITGTLDGRHVSARIKRRSVIVAAASAGGGIAHLKRPRPLAAQPPISIDLSTGQ